MASEVTKADIQKSRRLIADLSDLERRINQAKAMGLECDEQEARCTHAKKFLLSFNEIHSPEVGMK